MVAQNALRVRAPRRYARPMVTVGTVVALNLYPVKSMAGVGPAEVELRWKGIEGDRQYAFVRTGDVTRFPWLSARDLSRLVLYRAAFDDPAEARRSPVSVITPEGERLPLDSPALCERLSRECGKDLRLLQSGRGLYDAMPVSIATTATHRAIDGAHGGAVDPARFRTNIVIDSGAREIEWSGGLLAFGAATEGAFEQSGPRLLAGAGIPRCALITIDPANAARDPAIMRTVAQRFGNEVGVYCATATPGTIRVGDEVRFTRGL